MVIYVFKATYVAAANSLLKSKVSRRTYHKRYLIMHIKKV